MDVAGGAVATRSAVTGILFTGRPGVEGAQSSLRRRVQLAVGSGVLGSVTGSASKPLARIVEVGKGGLTLDGGVAAVDGTGAVGLARTTASATVAQTGGGRDRRSPPKTIRGPGPAGVLHFDGELGAIEVVPGDLEGVQELDRQTARTVPIPSLGETVREGTALKSADTVQGITADTDVRDGQTTIDALSNLHVVGRAGGRAAVADGAPENLRVTSTIVPVADRVAMRQNGLDDLQLLVDRGSTRQLANGPGVMLTNKLGIERRLEGPVTGRDIGSDFHFHQELHGGGGAGVHFVRVDLVPAVGDRGDVLVHTSATSDLPDVNVIFLFVAVGDGAEGKFKLGGGVQVTALVRLDKLGQDIRRDGGSEGQSHTLTR
jgi:hypothetical protein